jgi:hypothetical protein
MKEELLLPPGTGVTCYSSGSSGLLRKSHLHIALPDLVGEDVRERSVIDIEFSM